MIMPVQGGLLYHCGAISARHSACAKGWIGPMTASAHCAARTSAAQAMLEQANPYAQGVNAAYLRDFAALPGVFRHQRRFTPGEAVFS